MTLRRSEEGMLSHRHRECGRQQMETTASGQRSGVQSAKPSTSSSREKSGKDSPTKCLSQGPKPHVARENKSEGRRASQSGQCAANRDVFLPHALWESTCRFWRRIFSLRKARPLLDRSHFLPSKMDWNRKEGCDGRQVQTCNACVLFC